MSRYVPMETPGGIVWVEVDAQSLTGQVTQAGATNMAIRKFEETVNALKANARAALDILREGKEGLEPDEIEMSFGISAGIEGGIPFFGLAKVSGEASYTVTMKWNKAGKELPTTSQMEATTELAK